MNCRKRGDAKMAERAFLAALMATHRGVHIPGPSGTATENLALRALALCNMSVLHFRHGHPDARHLQDQAMEFLDQSSGCEKLPPDLTPVFQELMAEVLVELSEYRRAIPYCEATIQFLAGADNALAVAESMWRAGRCYSKVGLRDHAAVPLRAAVKIFRTLAGDPRLPVVLLDLGNALRKSSPAEAEQCYREVAEYHVSRAQLESATPAWINLAIIYNEQGRCEEALEFYNRALHVREQSPRTPPDRIGTLLNNISNVHRRMRNFEQAMEFADRAFPLLKQTGGHSLACLYGTKGLIHRDAGGDAEAVEWFRKSSAEHRKQASPNLETLSEELENEAAALQRLGRCEEAAAARKNLEDVRSTMAGVKASSPAVDLAGMTLSSEGAVLVELDCGSRTANGKSESTKLAHRLSSLVNSQGTGHYAGVVMIPESATLMFYGADADELFGTIEPAVREEPVCGGAKITIRQGRQHREVLVPGRLM